MKIKTLFAAVVVIITLIVAACRKDSLIYNNNKGVINALHHDNAISSCDMFAYPDTIFYPNDLPNDYIVKPVNTLSGLFGCYPDGLKIDKLTGNIDISESETGLKYMVWFKATGSNDTCKKFITVSGINYIDSIYTLKNASPVATPSYNATHNDILNCTDCEFDDGPDDDDNDGVADEPLPGQEVIPQGIAMDKKTGAINLKQSLLNGALGPNPKPGTFKDFILNYRLADGSSKALNKLIFRMYYFKTQSQIPPALKKDLQTKRSFLLFNDDGQTEPQNISYKTSASAFTSLTGSKEKEVKCRPPYIIVVQQ